MHVFISGPMSGIPRNNLTSFTDAAQALIDAGHTVVSMAGLLTTHFTGRTDLPRRLYMEVAMTHLMGCEAIALLPGWERSLGAKAEATTALAMDLKFVHYRLGHIISPPAEINITALPRFNWDEGEE
jgi:tryptophan synthase beta subunit